MTAWILGLVYALKISERIFFASYLKHVALVKIDLAFLRLGYSGLAQLETQKKTCYTTNTFTGDTR